ncbi:MAG: hypothetical protein QXN35_01020 [Ignisphaera sp.]
MKGRYVAITGFVSGLLVYLVMNIVFGLGVSDSMFIALTVCTAVAASISFSERDANIGVVAAFVGICISVLILSYMGIVGGGGYIAFVYGSASIYIPTHILPYLAISLVGLYGAGYIAGLDMKRFTMFMLSVVAILLYFVVPDKVIRLMSVTIAALVASTPLIVSDSNDISRYLASAVPIPIIATIDLSAVDVGAVIFPILSFIAIDPTRRIRDSYRQLSSICMLVIVLLMLVDLMLNI